MLTGEVKAILVDCLTKFLLEFQEKRSKVTDEDVAKFMEIRKMNPYPKAWAADIAKKEAEKAAAKKIADEKAAKELEGAEEKRLAALAKKEAKKKAAVEFAKKKKEEEERKKAMDN